MQKKVVKTFIFFVFLTQSISSLSNASAQTINTFDTPTICESIQSAVKQLPASSDAMEWPKNLHIPGVFFPKWTDIDPAQSLKLVEENYTTEKTEYNSLEVKSLDSRVEKNLIPTTSELDIIWNRLEKPRFVNAISKNQFEFQQTNLWGLSGQIGKITVFRFRANSPQKIKIQIKMTPIEGLYGWEYVVRIYDKSGSYKDYPIAVPPNPIRGELAVIQNSIVIFLTTEIINSGISEVYLPPGPSWWSGSGLATSDACVLNFR